MCQSRVNSLSRREESWKNELSACLSVRRVKRTLLIENIKLSFLVLSVGRVMVGGRGGEMPPPLRGQRNTLPGSKKYFPKKSIFLLWMSKKGFSEWKNNFLRNVDFREIL